MDILHREEIEVEAWEGSYTNDYSGKFTFFKWV